MNKNGCFQIPCYQGRNFCQARRFGPATVKWNCCYKKTGTLSYTGHITTHLCGRLIRPGYPYAIVRCNKMAISSCTINKGGLFLRLILMANMEPLSRSATMATSVCTKPDNAIGLPTPIQDHPGYHDFRDLKRNRKLREYGFKGRLRNWSYDETCRMVISWCSRMILLQRYKIQKLGGFTCICGRRNKK